MPKAFRLGAVQHIINLKHTIMKSSIFLNFIILGALLVLVVWISRVILKAIHRKRASMLRRNYGDYLYTAGYWDVGREIFLDTQKKPLAALEKCDFVPNMYSTNLRYIPCEINAFKYAGGKVQVYLEPIHVICSCSIVWISEERPELILRFADLEDFFWTGEKPLPKTLQVGQKVRIIHNMCFEPKTKMFRCSFEPYLK